MASVGNRQDKSQFNKGYSKDPLAKLTSKFLSIASDIMQENHLSIFEEAGKICSVKSARQALEDFFIEDSCDRTQMSVEEYDEHVSDMRNLFQNDSEVVREHSSAANFNPVIGMSFPIHKNIMMNTIFDKGAITKMVALSPKFTLSLETRILETPDGREIDMFKQQNELFEAIENTVPFKDTILVLPEIGNTNVLAETFTAVDRNTNLSIESAVTAVAVKTYVADGGTYWDAATKTEKVMDVSVTDKMQLVWFNIPKKAFVPAYGEYDRQLMDSVTVKTTTDAAGTVKIVKGMLSGAVKKNRFTIQCTSADVAAVKLTSRIDSSSAMLETCQVKWSVRTDMVEIPNAIPLNTTVSPEEVKDIGALYQVNQLTKIMSMFNTVLGNYKDDKIRASLDTSFVDMAASSKLAATFDFAPRDGYMLDHIEWRQKTFMDMLDTQVTTLLQVLNDPNMTITVIGRPDLVRKITPTEYNYTSPSSIGPVELDFVKTVVTSDKRTYQFISSDKLRGNNNLIVILNPRNTERIVYRIYDYQMYVSNEIRNSANPALPAIHAFERFKFVEYQPVQARIKILNPSGLRTMVDNTDPIGTNYMNDVDSATGYNANRPTTKADGTPL